MPTIPAQKNNLTARKIPAPIASAILNLFSYSFIYSSIKPLTGNRQAAAPLTIADRTDKHNRCTRARDVLMSPADRATAPAKDCPRCSRGRKGIPQQATRGFRERERGFDEF
ncbi:hypothetical protein QUB68_25850 [Microcoleus sp. A006_D1]|uniref:hypothetical protein n=1 Tax=Microcoleus sp. A006_D1 TaxID=3055267 RepID=UPI002FD5A71A